MMFFGFSLEFSNGFVELKGKIFPFKGSLKQFDYEVNYDGCK